MVSRNASPKRWRNLCTATLTAPSLARLEWSEANSRRYFESGSGLVRDVAAKVCAEADIGADRISVVFGTNSNVFCLQMTGLAAGLSSSRVYQRNLARHAHVFGCDALLGLKTYCEETEFPQQGFALMIGWAPYVASACLLRRV